MTYQKLAIDYESFLSNNFSFCYVVFDGYEGPSITDHEHLQRFGKISVDITVTANVS